MARDKAPRIVAELGRPETAEETAARRAEASRKRRANQTVFNLVLALLASLGIVLLLVLVVVRPDQPPRAAVDYVETAAQAQPAVSERLFAPTLPPAWTANNATLDTAGESFVWKVGFITPAQQFIALEQGIDTGASWVAGRLGRLAATSTTDIGGVTWDVYDRRDANDPGNFAYSLVADLGGSEVLLHGTASDEEFITLAAAIAADAASTTEGAPLEDAPAIEESP